MESTNDWRVKLRAEIIKKLVLNYESISDSNNIKVFCKKGYEFSIQELGEENEMTLFFKNKTSEEL